ncbi:hypothetical protein CTI12_AA562730 [Artemisia annua]|uniref:Uncharacterized protein n=1 Tax=Artemisia annua TaxID=35608 RepID=A0A2U1KNL1_ARTAN|nr:hypothetical protein CTI12_AA562730 [Artemisia annua]
MSYHVVKFMLPSIASGTENIDEIHTNPFTDLHDELFTSSRIYSCIAAPLIMCLYSAEMNFRLMWIIASIVAIEQCFPLIKGARRQQVQCTPGQEGSTVDGPCLIDAEHLDKQQFDPLLLYSQVFFLFFHVFRIQGFQILTYIWDNATGSAIIAMPVSGAEIDDSVNRGRGPYVFKISGQIYHWIGAMCPEQDKRPKFLQLYIYDTHNEVANRL